jgi:hypothetical protein
MDGHNPYDETIPVLIEELQKIEYDENNRTE